MADFILVNNDIVLFLPAFSPAVVVPLPGTIAGSGSPINGTGKPVCVDGDESKVQVAGCMYVAPPFVIPGVGTLKIQAIASDQKAKKVKAGGKAVLLKGIQFDAVFEVQTPAQMPPPASSPDPTPKYPGGKGMFISTNLLVKAS